MDNSVSEMVKILHAKHGKSALTKTETASELGVGLSTLTKHMMDGIDLPEYIKLGNAKNATVLFPISSIAEYLTRTTKVV